MRPNDLPHRTGLPFNLLLATALSGLIAAGCSNNRVTGPAKPVPLTLMAIGPATSGGSATAARGSASLFAASDTMVTLTSALLVVRDVRFKLTEEGGVDDSLETGDGPDSSRDHSGDHDSTGMREGEGDQRGDDAVVFRGPFVIDLLSHTADSLDTEMVPPGDYRRVQGHLAPLRPDDWNASKFDYLVGSTVYLKGTVNGEGGGPFTYQARIDNEFQIRGKFTVQADTRATAFITFDLSRWLRDRSGAFLDPRLPENDQPIRSAIRHSIKAGMDDNHDGECDDDMHAESD